MLPEHAGANALIVGAPRMGHTNTVMTMITAGALDVPAGAGAPTVLRRQWPSISSAGTTFHMWAAVAALYDTEGVTRLLATVRGIVDERERLFATRGLDMEQVGGRSARTRPILRLRR